MRSWLRLLVVIAAGVLAATAAWAQDGPIRSTWENLSRLQSGQHVQVLVAGAIHSGEFTAVDAQGITLHEKSADHTIARADVREVRIASRRLRHTAIGAAIGAGGGVAFGAATASKVNCGSQPYCFASISKGAWIGALAGIGAAVGAIVGALVPAHITLYREGN